MLLALHSSLLAGHVHVYHHVVILMVVGPCMIHSE